MKYVLESSQHKGCYLSFKHNQSPKIVSLLKAQKFDSSVSALNRTSTIPKSLSSYGPWRAVAVDEIVGSIEKNDNYYVVPDYESKLDETLWPIKKILGNKEILENALQKLEQIEIDLNHYVEFNKLKVSSGYWAYKIQHILRNKRRKIKEELYYIDYLQTASIPHLLSGKDKPNPDSQKYRVRTEIMRKCFDEATLTKETAEQICKEIEEII